MSYSFLWMMVITSSDPHERYEHYHSRTEIHWVSPYCFLCLQISDHTIKDSVQLSSLIRVKHGKVEYILEFPSSSTATLILWVRALSLSRYYQCSGNQIRIFLWRSHCSSTFIHTLLFIPNVLSCFLVTYVLSPLCLLLFTYVQSLLLE